MNQNTCLEKKKRNRTHKQPCEHKSKAKQIDVYRLFDDKQAFVCGNVVKGKRTRVCDIYNNAEEQYMCLERAGILLERLDAELPKFAKCMIPSNVLYSFWLILPKNFCIMHFPEHDTTVTLVDESGKEFKTNYLKARNGLSGGWRGFSIAQKLLQGDILFFHLVGTCKLKVHIVRRYGLEAVEAAICLMEMHPRVKRTRMLNSGNYEKPKQEKVKNEKRTKRNPKKCRCPTQVDTKEDGQWTRLDVECDHRTNVFSAEVVVGI